MLAAQNFELGKQILRSKLKIVKHIAVDDLTKTFAMILFSSRSNLAGQYLIKVPKREIFFMYRSVPLCTLQLSLDF